MKNICALITGATKGIGKAIAITLDSLGYNLVLCARSINELNDLNHVLHNKHTIVGGDLNTVECQLALMEEFESHTFPDIIVANMNPIPIYKMLINWEHQEIQDITGSVNYLLPIIKPALLHQQKNEYGRWVAISSEIASNGGFGQGIYCMQKNILESLFLTIASEYSGNGITANIISPGLIETEKTINNKYFEKLSKMNAVGRAGYPEEVAHIVAALVDKNAAYITGATIHVNGGSNLFWHVKKG